MCSAKKKEDRRRAQRIECKNVLVNYRKVGLLRRVMNRAPSLDEKAKKHPVLDISRTGVSFLTSDELEEGQELVMRISFGPRRPSVEVNGEVTRREEGKGQYDYSVGARFVDITPETWNTLLHLNKFVIPPKESDAWKLRRQGGGSKSKSWAERMGQNTRERLLKERFLNLTSEVEVDNLKVLLDDRKGRPCNDVDGAEPSHRRVAGEIRNLRKSVDSVDAEADPLRAYLQIEELGDRFSCLEEVDLPEDLAKRRGILEKKLENKRKGVETKWTKRAHRVAGKIANLGRKVDRVLDRMIMKIQEAPTDIEGSGWAGITEHTRVLNEVIRRIEALVDRVPQASCQKSLPFWNLLKEAHQNLLKPHSRNVFLFKCAAAIAHAGGDMKARQRDLLGSIADELHLSSHEEKELIRRARDLEAGEFDGSPEDAREVIHNLYLCATGDGEMCEAEERVLKRIGANWGVDEQEVQQILEERREVNRLSKRGVTLMKKLIKQVKEGHIENSPEMAKKFHKDVVGLANLIRDVENKVSRIPEMRVIDLPDWDLLESARENVIRPHTQNVFLLKASIRMVAADGKATGAEQDFLNAILDQMRYPRSLAMELIEHPGEVTLPEFDGTRKQARAMVQKLYRCALADGAVDEAEKEFLEEVANQLGVSRPEMVDEMTNPGDHAAASFLDRAAVMKRVEELDELGEGIKVGDDIDDQIREYIDSNFEVPEEDAILVTYENYLMGEMLECGALTPHSLFLQTPGKENRSVDISDIKGIEADAVATFLILKGDRKIQMSRMAEPFIHLVLDSVRENQRYV